MISLQTDAPITPRQRMQQDMVMRGMGSQTQHNYVHGATGRF